MTTWYGWLAFAATVGFALHDGTVLVINAWRREANGVTTAIAWFAIWTTLAIGLWVSP